MKTQQAIDESGALILHARLAQDKFGIARSIYQRQKMTLEMFPPLSCGP